MKHPGCQRGVSWEGGGRATVGGAGFTGGWGCGLGLVGGFGGLLDRVIYCIILQFPGKSIKNTFPDRVIYWVILQFSLLDRVIYWVILQFHLLFFAGSPFGVFGTIFNAF